jgi:hypothetical protein
LWITSSSNALPFFLLLEAVLLRFTAGSAHSKVIPSLDLAPEPGRFALALIDVTDKPVISEAASIVSKVLVVPSL